MRAQLEQRSSAAVASRSSRTSRERPAGGLESEYGVELSVELLEDDDARVRERLRLLLGPLLASGRSAVAVACEMIVRSVLLESAQARVDQRALVRRHDDDVDDRERARDDDKEREGEPAADAAERVHVSRKR